ncbi:MAG: glycoside hydrolase [Gemmatimonadota bacterium]
MRFSIGGLALAFVLSPPVPFTASAQEFDLSAAMRWREIGPTRAGRARALSGVANQPNVFYIGFDNGGLWRSTDYGSNWLPLFDQESTGSIGAIAVAPSDPNVIYVGSGAGIIRPDLATGDGMYKSTDAGKTWIHLGLRESQMIAMVDVDPANPNRLFVAVLGHPYGPNRERGVFRSLDGGQTFDKVLYKDEYTSANDVRISPANPNTVFATLWQQQEAFWEGGGFGGGGNGIFKSTDGGTTWKPVMEGLPSVLQANIGIAPSNPDIMYAMVAAANPNGGSGPVGFYKSTDAGEHWFLAIRGPGASPNDSGPAADGRPLRRIGGGDLPTIAIDPKDPNVVYSASTVMWRTEDGGLTWSAVRGSPGGDDYQKIWINPVHPDVLLVVSDQGGVVSANRGLSWSNWYNQPTAAMYHVTTDDAFPYRVCSGQQDSGSACVDSRSMDGEITFHDWHPVNIQEYGIAAPDPRDPDLVFGSMRTNVSLYNRRTGQTTFVGPDAGARGTAFGRNVRTMPIAWSPVAPNILLYTSNAVWKSVDHAASWTRISPDLARPTWTAPASAGKYAGSVTPGPRGTITAMSLSTRSLGSIWAGTDDGNIQVTMDGGAHWTDVTPPSIKPWTRIFNIEAGHFDGKTAYAAANTMRIDEAMPHFFRTHDGGKSWTEINAGLTAGAVANAIREDPRQAGLLYAATETQVWFSTDDGDHWQSLRLNMPAISVRDIEVKDDSSCLCADLVAGTHGRGFWILDDLTPLRQLVQVKAAAAAASPYVVRPEPAVRVRFGTNDPTPWPPEVPAGENPPPGAIIDYYLPADQSGPVRLEILDRAGTAIRSFMSTNPTLRPDPGVEPEAYDQICRKTPTATDCGLPLYWPAPAMTISDRAGMHRFAWDMRLQPVIEEDIDDAGDEDATGAVPHRTPPAVNAPWAPRGTYTIRLTAGGKSATQPLVVRLDPRVKTPAAGLAKLDALSMEMHRRSAVVHAAYERARRLSAGVATLSGADADAFKARIDSLAPARTRGARPQFRRPGAAPAQPTLSGATTALVAAAMAMQGADVAPTAGQVAACERARVESAAVMDRWSKLETAELRAFNAKRAAAGQPTVARPER